MAVAVWSMNVISKTRNATTGTAKMIADLLDAGVVQGQVTVTITEGRAMRFDWTASPAGVASPLTGFEAWSNT